MISSSCENICELIAHKKWKRLKLQYFFCESSVWKTCCSCSEQCESSHSALHLACQSRAPLDVIKFLYKTHPKSVFERDCKGRSLLHVACKNGCSPKAIQFLLEKNPDAAKQKDDKNRSPFLQAFKSYVQNSGRDWIEANQDLHAVAGALDSAESSCYMDEDYEGKSALEYAIVGELCIGVVRQVQQLICIQRSRGKKKNRDRKSRGKKLLCPLDKRKGTVYNVQEGHQGMVPKDHN